MKKTDAKDKLVQAMGTLIATRGMAGTSPKDILQTAEVGHGSLYYHFSGKQDLALAAIENNAARLITRTQETLATADTPYGKIEALLTRPRDIQFGCEIGNLTRDHKIMSDPELRAPIQEAFDWLVSTLEVLIRDGMMQGDLHPSLEPKEAALMIVSVVQGGYVTSRAFQDNNCFAMSARCVLQLLRSRRPD